MTTDQRNIIVSQYVPSGSWAHRESPFTKLNRGFNPANPSENVLSSAWLWKALEQKQIIPRYTMGFPEEWSAFEQAEGSAQVLKNCSLDLWVFRSLDADEIVALAENLDKNHEFRAVIAVNHLADWQALVQSPILKKYFQDQRVFISFLQAQHEMDPFLKPQEVLWQLKDIPAEVPILIQDFPEAQTSFFHSLNKEDLSREMKKQNPFLVRSFKVMDRTGLGHFILFFEAFLGFLVSYRMLRLFQAIAYFFQLAPWHHLIQKVWVVIWHRSSYPVLNFLWYKMIFKPLDWLCNAVIRKYAILIWYKLFAQIYGVVVHQTAVLLWHRTLWPVIIFIRYQIFLKIWIFLRYRMIEILLFLAYPLRKIYWIASHEYDKRIRYRIRRKPHES